jgi:iron(III) transport system permease protein
MRNVAWWAALAAVGAVCALAVAGDPRGRTLLTNTLAYAGAVSAASMLLGAPLAFLLARTDVPGRRLAGVALSAILFTPLYLIAAAWQAGFGFQGWLSLAVGGVSLLDGWRGAVFIQTMAAVPWVVLIAGVGLRLAEAELEEEAILDGTPGQVFRRVTLRRTAESLITAFLWVFVATAGEMTVTDLYLIRTYAEEIYTQFALGDTLEGAVWQLAPSMALVIWIIMVGLFVVARLIPPDRHDSQRQLAPFRLRRWRAAAAAISLLGVGVLVLVLVPIVSLAVQAGRVVTRVGDSLERGWLAAQFMNMTLGSPLRFAREIAWTVGIGALAAGAVVAVGLPLAWHARHGGWRAAPAWLLVAVALAMPGPLVGLAIIELFNSPNVPLLHWLYDHSIAPIWLAQTWRAMPLPTLILWYGLRTIPAEMLHGAQLEGASPLARFFRVALPQRWHVVAVAWLAAFALASGELDASILVVPPGVSTLPIHIFGLIHYGVDDQVAGVSLFLFAAFVVYALAFLWVARRTIRDLP